MNLSVKQSERLKKRYSEWAVVTGASSGIGLELSNRVAEAGLNVVMIARNHQVLQEKAKTIQHRHGVDVRTIPVDVSEPAGLTSILDETSELKVGLLVVSAGYGTSGRFVDSSINIETNMLDVNCRSLLVLTHHFAKLFAMQRRGGIILMSSIVAFQGVPYAAHYAATKAYVQTLAEGLALELKPFGVDVLAAAPGPVASGFESRAKMKMTRSLQPIDIGVHILTSLGKRSTVFPGPLTKLLIAGLRTVPRWGKVRIMAKVMGGMTRHQREEENKLSTLSKSSFP